VGRAEGVTEAQLLSLADYATSDAFSPLERLVLDYVAALCATPVDVPDALYAALRNDLDDAQMVELTAAVAWENYRARFNRAFQIPAQGFSDGAVCALPARAPTR
jgi:alkylhydroperoxidase family enzyme